MKKYRPILKESEYIDTSIDKFLSMITNKKFDKQIWLNGLEAMNDKYNMKEDPEFKSLRGMIMSYSNNPNKRNMLSKEIVKEFEYLREK